VKLTSYSSETSPCISQKSFGLLDRVMRQVRRCRTVAVKSSCSANSKGYRKRKLPRSSGSPKRRSRSNSLAWRETLRGQPHQARRPQLLRPMKRPPSSSRTPAGSGSIDGGYSALDWAQQQGTADQVALEVERLLRRHRRRRRMALAGGALALRRSLCGVYRCGQGPARRIL
jgi:hypothetical protein